MVFVSVSSVPNVELATTAIGPSGFSSHSQTKGHQSPALLSRASRLRSGSRGHLSQSSLSRSPRRKFSGTVNIDDRHQRVHATVGLYSERILYALRTEETAPDVWFVVIPDVVYENCRPRSRVSSQVQVHADYRLVPRKAQRTRAEPMLFEQMNREAEPYYYEVDFHNQLKARLLSSLALTQIVRESTISPINGIPE